MNTTLMDAPAADPVVSKQAEVAEIISKARTARPGSLRSLVPSLTAALLLWLAFTPVDWGPLAWIALVPLLVLVRLPQAPSHMYKALYLGGLGFWLAALQWMRFGDATMYPAWSALSVYLALYWPLFVWLARIGVHRFRVPLVAAAPVLWTGLELLRSRLFTGFAWYLLGHSQHRWVEVIQISDLFGAYAVGFIIVVANACVAEFVPLLWAARLGLVRRGELPLETPSAIRNRRLVAAMMMALCLSAAIGYGYFRRSRAEFEPGPRVALIQGNYPAYVRAGQTADEVFQEWQEIYRTHRALTGLTVTHQPDVIIWPETMFRFPLLEYEEGMTDKDLAAVRPQIPPEQWKETSAKENLIEMAEEAGAALIIGADVLEATPQHGPRHFNSAVFLDPDKGWQGRYDKIHRVPFGEYVPLRETLSFLQNLTPYSGDFGIDAGESVQRFERKGYGFLPIICFEDTVPELVRDMVHRIGAADQSVDCLVNLSNDGWFHGSSELEQHLIAAKFRCIETRVPMVRAVNTGISAIIDGDGVVREPDVFIDLDARLAGERPREGIRDPKTGAFYKQLNCALVGNVPLDPRSSLYVKWGDWFAMLCLFGCCVTALHGLLIRPPHGGGATNRDVSTVGK